MSIYQRGENWYIDFTFKGQRIRESIGPSRKGAEKVIAKKKAEIAENKFLDKRKDPDPITFHNFAKEYLGWSKTNKKDSTCVRELSTMRVFDVEFGTKDIQSITTWQVEKYKAKRKEEVKPASVNRELALLKSIYSKAILWDKAKENPVKRVKLLKGVVKRVRFLMPGEVQTLLSNCSNDLRPIVTVAVHTGMRRGEILGLKREQINLDQGIVSILDTKNHERRDIPMDKTVKDILKSMMEKPGEFIFFTESGERLSNSFIQRGFQEAVKKSGFQDFRFHDLRHTFASNLVMAGQDLNTVGELLGHKSLEMTRRYAHLSPAHKTKSVTVLDKLLTQIPPQIEAVEKVVSINR